MSTKDALKSGLYTALFTFIGSMFILMLGWLQVLASWSSANGHAPLPGISTIGYAVLGAFISAMSGFVAFLLRWIQSKGVNVPGLQSVQFVPETPATDAPPPPK